MDEESRRVRITIDDRDARAGLGELLTSSWTPVHVARLPVGDVEIGEGILVERKTVLDFVASLGDGRLFAQARAMTRVCARPLIVLEGEETIAAAHIHPVALRGVLLTLMVGFRVPLLRTSGQQETADTILHVARRESRRLERMDQPGSQESSSARRALAVLAQVPGVGDHKARALLTRFGSLRDVMLAEPRDLERTPGIGKEVASTIRAVVDDPASPKGGGASRE